MKRVLAIVALGLVLAVSACVTVPVSGGGAPTSGPSIPSTPIDLGDWRRATPGASSQFFEREINERYRVGMALTMVSSDLRRNDFNCTGNRDTSGRGDPPDQICRKTVTSEGCTHTWQVHLFDANGDSLLARTRALYDRRCGNDGLLGGPG
jgi:hypothetical protein